VVREEEGIVVGWSSWGLVGIGGVEGYRGPVDVVEDLLVMEVSSRGGEEMRKSVEEDTVSVWDRDVGMR